MASEEQTDLLVPLVEAKPIPHAAGVVVDEEVFSVPAAKKVRLKAPSDLPGGYRLSIKYLDEGGEMVYGYCRVPNEGVDCGDQFEAEIVPPNVINGRWAAGVLSSFGSVQDGSFMLATVLSPAVAWGCLYESAFQIPTGLCRGLLLVLTLLQFVFATTDDDDSSSPVPLVSCILLLIIVVFSRWRIRQKYRIAGNCCDDCLCVTFCSCCSAAQAYHHMKLAHDEPRNGTTALAERTPAPQGSVV